MKSWTYYNHAMIPTGAPHEKCDLNALKDKKFWNTNKKALLARWTSDFDCNYKTNWWYVIKDGVFDIEVLSSKTRKHIRQAFKKVYVKNIDMKKYSKELSNVYNNACLEYKEFTGTLTTAYNFQQTNDNRLDCWGAFSIEDDKLIGYMTCKRFSDYVETITAKYDPKYLNLRASDAIHCTILDYYLNQCKYRYVCSGSRNINHITNVQEYKIQTFGFRKAYCNLHIVFNPKIKVLVRLLYHLRCILYKLDKIKHIHLINSVLKMMELCADYNNDNII